MSGRTRLVAAVVAAAMALAGTAAGLSALLGGGQPTTAIASADVVRDRLDAGATVIDVRTPEEYAEGHVVDALLADLEGGAFDDVAADLPRDASYVVYCASGRRAAIAVDRMIADGFTDVVNGGGFDDMTDLGAPVQVNTRRDRAVSLLSGDEQ
ncbi:MAG: rhodanese-like domain-containing protein [Nocardioides sp.]